MEHTRRVKTLYKIILRLHRGLPKDLRALGDSYAKDEFKRHKKCNPHEADIFMIEWTKYATTLAKQITSKDGYKSGKGYGDQLHPELIEKLTDGQTVQLYELMKAAGYID